MYRHDSARSPHVSHRWHRLRLPIVTGLSDGAIIRLIMGWRPPLPRPHSPWLRMLPEESH